MSRLFHTRRLLASEPSLVKTHASSTCNGGVCDTTEDHYDTLVQLSNAVNAYAKERKFTVTKMTDKPTERNPKVKVSVRYYCHRARASENKEGKARYH